MVTTLSDLTRDEILRYSRHITLPEVGTDGQQRLKSTRVTERPRRSVPPGFSNARNLTGGILAWIDQVDPTQPKY